MLSKFYYNVEHTYNCAPTSTCSFLSDMETCQKTYGNNKYAKCTSVETKLVGMEAIQYPCYRHSTCTNHVPTNEILQGPTKTIVEIRARTFEEFMNENADHFRTAGIVAGVGLVCLGIAYLGMKIYQRCRPGKSEVRQGGPPRDKLGQTGQGERMEVQKRRSSLLAAVYDPSDARRSWTRRERV